MRPASRAENRDAGCNSPHFCKTRNGGQPLGDVTTPGPSTPQIIALRRSVPVGMTELGGDWSTLGRGKTELVWGGRLSKLTIATLTSQNQSEVGIGLFLRR